MKRYRDLMPRIATRENVGLGFHKAALGKRCLPTVRHFMANFDFEINRIVRELTDGSWQPGAYERFQVRDPKVRLIHAAPFRDRVVHHAIMNVCGPLFERGAVDQSFACRLGRGNLAAVHHAARCAKSRQFFLKLDIRKYFDSVHHETLRGLFLRRFKDGRLLDLLDRVLTSFETAPGRGLPIGTLTSQYFANHYLDGMDHRLMEFLPCPAYARYMDDFVLWHDDEKVLDEWLEEIRAWLGKERQLVLKGAPQPAPCREGIPFLGYRVLPGRILLGRRARRRFREQLLSHEAAHAAGRMTGAQLQRCMDALLAFVQVADCQKWLHRTLIKRTAILHP